MQTLLTFLSIISAVISLAFLTIIIWEWMNGSGLLIKILQLITSVALFTMEILITALKVFLSEGYILNTLLIFLWGFIATLSAIWIYSNCIEAQEILDEIERQESKEQEETDV